MRNEIAAKLEKAAEELIRSDHAMAMEVRESGKQCQDATDRQLRAIHKLHLMVQDLAVRLGRLALDLKQKS